jgi:hypothetical protein
VKVRDFRRFMAALAECLPVDVSSAVGPMAIASVRCGAPSLQVFNDLPDEAPDPHVRWIHTSDGE